MKGNSFCLLSLLCLLILSAPALAQDGSPGSRPGSWYVGIKHEGNNSLPGRVQFGLQVGRLLTPRLALQSGFTPAHVRQDWPSWWPEDELFHPFTGTMYLTHYTTGAHVPFHLRYLFSKPHRRVQAYGMAGIHTYFQSSKSTPLTYQDGLLTNRLPEVRHNNFKVEAGVAPGVRVRTVDRLFVYLEAPFGWAVRRRNPDIPRMYNRSFFTQRVIGLQYEFR
jgi:hypothetical protein